MATNMILYLLDAFRLMGTMRSIPHITKDQCAIILQKTNEFYLI